MGVNVALKRYITITVILNPDGLKDLIRYMKDNRGTASLQGINLNRYDKVSDAGLLLTKFHTVVLGMEAYL